MTRKAYNAAARGPSDAEKALIAWGVAYERLPDGSLRVPGDLDISSRGLEALPDLSKVVVDGAFACHENRLTSLKGAPQQVGGGFYCGLNRLTTLEHAPRRVGGAFMCQGNDLTSLEHAPRDVGGDFICSNNRLASLDGAPARVPGRFTCHNNKLRTLKGAPASVSDEFFCTDNPLTALEGAPRRFSNITCDLGAFSSWKEVPVHLRISEETIAARLAAKEYAIHAATVLQAPTQVGRPLRFKDGGPA